ncbi:MAG: hypothetical protein ABEJ91_02640 [Candidatus Nanohaloarchaea archaeon]
MICLTSLVVFSILGIFSSTHRELAKEAFDCVTSKARNQPCETDLEDRVRASVIGRTLEYSPRVARTLRRHFELFSWLFLLTLLVTGAYSVFSLYNLAVYGSCAGQAAQGGCSLGSGTPWIETAKKLLDIPVTGR